MSTSALINILNEDNKTLVTIYKHSDGYPEGLGLTLAEFLKDICIVNGIGSKNPVESANGMECLAAQIVAFLKMGVGGVYIYPANSEDIGEEYVYTISMRKDYTGNDISHISVYDVHEQKRLFNGFPKEYIEYAKSI